MKKAKGMSLTEITVCIFILGIISAPIYFVLSDSNKKANIALARDGIKQEANKIFKILENDLTQARKNTFKREGNVTSIEVRKNQKKDMPLRYSFDRPVLHRTVDGKSWIVSKQVDKIDIDKALDGNGKLVVNLVMKSNYVGLLDEEQPTYEQNKLIVMIEDATEPNDPYWREVGDVSKFFQTQGSLLAGLKEDATKLIQDFTGTWNAALGDIKNMTIGQLRDVVKDLKKNLEDVKKNLSDINLDISNLDWHAMYDESSLLGKVVSFGQKDKKNKACANRIREKIASLKSLEDMKANPFESIVSGARKGLKKEAIREMYEAKKQLFEARKNLKGQLDKIKKEADGDVGIDLIPKDLLGND